MFISNVGISFIVFVQLRFVPDDDAFERGELCARPSPPLWLRVALCRTAGQVPGFALGQRGRSTRALCGPDVPGGDKDKPIGTGGSGTYLSFFNGRPHRVLGEGCGQASLVEGPHTKWRQRPWGGHAAPAASILGSRATCWGGPSCWWSSIAPTAAGRGSAANTQRNQINSPLLRRVYTPDQLTFSGIIESGQNEPCLVLPPISHSDFPRFVMNFSRKIYDCPNKPVM
jgi:hypothetical protein